jgi:hypothetical protein
MSTPSPTGRRDLLTAGALSLAAPVLARPAQSAPIVGVAAQPAAAPGQKEAAVFNLWVISDPHVGTDKAMSTAVQHGMVGFTPPPVHMEIPGGGTAPIGERQCHRRAADPVGHRAQSWRLRGVLGRPEDEQGQEVIRQYAVLTQHRREQIYNIAGNHDASPLGHPASGGKEANWWFREWADPVGEHPETSLVDNARRPYPTDGTWERYTFKVGNIRFVMMSDRNDLPYPVGREASGGASPAGAVTEETFAWWKRLVETARANNEIIVSRHHHMLRETTVGSGDFEGVRKNPDGTYRRGKYHGADGAPEGASYLHFPGDKPKAQAFEQYFAAHPSGVDLWLGGHTHTFPDEVCNGRSHVEQKWGVNFVNCAQLSKFHGTVTCPPMSRHFTFTEGSPLVRVRCCLHDDTYAAPGWYPPSERVLEFSRPFFRS